MADLDTFTNEWTLLKVNTTGMDPKNGTAISASNWVSGDVSFPKITRPSL